MRTYGACICKSGARSLAAHHMPPSLNNGICTIIMREVPKNCGAGGSRGSLVAANLAFRVRMRGMAAATGRATAHARVEREEHAATTEPVRAHACLGSLFANPPGLRSRQTSRGHRWSKECPAASRECHDTPLPAAHTPRAHAEACRAADRAGHRRKRSCEVPARSGREETRPNWLSSRRRDKALAP